jgi:hypothetical protein
MRTSEEQPEGSDAPEASSVVLSAFQAAAGTLDPSSAPEPEVKNRDRCPVLLRTSWGHARAHPPMAGARPRPDLQPPSGARSPPLFSLMGGGMGGQARRRPKKLNQARSLLTQYGGHPVRRTFDLDRRSARSN